jgi:hypothetical protein
MSAIPIPDQEYSLVQETSDSDSSCEKQLDQTELRKKILAIQSNDQLTPSEKAKMIQVLVID